MNEDYLDAAKWNNNPNVIYEELPEKRAQGYTLKGDLGYYVDNSFSLYTYLNFEETSLTKSQNTVDICYHITTATEEYDFSVNAEGMNEASGAAEQQLFTVIQNFNAKTHEYIAAITYNGKESACMVNISLNINGHIYRNLKKDILMERPTTTKPEKTTQPKTTKALTAKGTTTKITTVKTIMTKNSMVKQRAAASKTSTNQKNKQRKNQTTKYTPRAYGHAAILRTTRAAKSRKTPAKAETAAAAEDTLPDNTAKLSAESTTTLVLQQRTANRPALTLTGKYLLLLSIMLAVAGCLALFFSTAKPKKEP